LVQQNAYYQKSIENPEELEPIIQNKTYDFISCNNVLQYVNSANLEPTLERMLNYLSINGVISLKTEETKVMQKISQYMQRH